MKEKLPVVVMHLQGVASERTEQAAKARAIVQELTTVTFIKMLHFMLLLVTYLLNPEGRFHMFFHMFFHLSVIQTAHKHRSRGLHILSKE